MSVKLYFDAEGNDDAAYQSVMKYACELSKNEAEIKNIVLLVCTKTNTGWFERLFGKEIVKKMFSGVRFKDCPSLYKLETLATYERFQYENAQDIVICCGLDADDIFKIDSYSSIKYIIAVPWQKELTGKWIKTWNAKDISGKSDGSDDEFPAPTAIVKRAMTNLTTTINMSTGISNPSDNNRAKTFIRALHKYENELNASVVSSYLIRELRWSPRHAHDIEKLINALNQGSFFHGGDKVGLQNYYKKWEKECEKSK
jgi:hypothetical protein